MRRESTTPEQTKIIARKIAAMFSGGEVIGLVGELGSGKTTFVQGIAEAFGVTNPVTSPTFSIMNIYPVRNHQTIKQLVHLDCYRLESEEQLADLGLEEWMRPDTVMLVEWPLMKTDQTITFDLLSGSQNRSIVIE